VRLLSDRFADYQGLSEHRADGIARHIGGASQFILRQRRIDRVNVVRSGEMRRPSS
jgi:hypothetical protein